MAQSVTCLLVGAGIRGRQYVQHAVASDKDFKPVAVAEPDDVRREAFGNAFGIPANRRFKTWQDAAKAGRVADCVINATLDDMHRDSAVGLLDLGYNMLLEKPIARTEKDMFDIANAAERNRATVMICHVLRYSPFYSMVKDVVESGRLGRIKHIRMSENVSWHHFGTAFVRGRFRNAKTAAPFILAKSCHDTDIMAWLLSGNPPKRVSAFGSLTHYVASNAPQGATDRCYDGCPHLKSCKFSAENIYVTGNMWRFRALGDFNGTDDEAREILKTAPHGRCVWKCDNDVTDQMSVSVEFADGAIGTLSSQGFATRPNRDIVIYGTDAELIGDMEESTFEIRTPNPPGGGFEREVVNTQSGSGDEKSGHGGGDGRLMRDFVNVMRGSGANRTRIEDSINGHRIGFAAEDSRLTGRWIEL